jgi:hypothetical protein
MTSHVKLAEEYTWESYRDNREEAVQRIIATLPEEHTPADVKYAIADFEFHLKTEAELKAMRRRWYAETYYLKNREEILEKQRQRYHDRTAARLKTVRKSQKKNKDKFKEYQKRYYEKNKERIAAKRKKYYQEHRDWILKRNAHYKEKNYDKVVEQKAQKYWDEKY